MGASASLARPPLLSPETVAALETLPESTKAELTEKWASIHAAAPIAQPAAAAGSLGTGGASGAVSAVARRTRDSDCGERCSSRPYIRVGKWLLRRRKAANGRNRRVPTHLTP